jgi:hypothetical protein
MDVLLLFPGKLLVCGVRVSAVTVGVLVASETKKKKKKKKKN